MSYNFSVLHATDFSEASQLAFVHALKIVLTCGTKLEILRINSGNLPVDSDKYPPVRATLERWGHLPKASSRAAVYNTLHFTVKKINSNNSNPHYSIRRHLDQHNSDLIVLPMQSQVIYPNYINYNVFWFLTQHTHDQYLFIPSRSRGFVSFYDGSVTLKNILIPVTEDLNPIPAIEEAVALVNAMGSGEEKITLLYIGKPECRPEINLSEFSDCQWDHIQLNGYPVDQIVALSYQLPADLIVLTTHGSKQCSNSNQKSIVKHVFENASCPILTIVSD